MILIADSGSTKTDWILVSSESSSSDSDQAVREHTSFTTQGLNPYHLSREQINRVLREEVASRVDVVLVEYVYFYGSGVTREMESFMQELIGEVFVSAKCIEAHSDMLGAARALCGRNYGIASILGTGANSALYDGKTIVSNTPALGYILGDEGSGAVLGKNFIHDLYKGILSEEIKADFEQHYGLSISSIINKVYREALPKADRLCLTYVYDTPKKADTFFPEIDENEWVETFREEHEADEKHAHPYAFVDLERKR